MDWRLLLLLGGAGIAGGLFLRKHWLKIRRNAHISRTDDLQDPNSYAQRLHQAFHPPEGGTDEELVREVIRKVPHEKFWESVIAVYGSGDRGSLLWDLEYELAEPMHREIMLIINSLPANEREAVNRPADYYDERMVINWAMRIKNACDYELGWLWPWGHDFDGIISVFQEIPYARVICEIDAYYRSYFYMSLWEELYGEFGGDGEKFEQLANQLKLKPDGKDKSVYQLLALCAG